MTFKKTWFGYLIWIGYSLAVCLLLGGTVLTVTDRLGIEQSYMQIGLVWLSFLVCAGLCLSVKEIWLKVCGRMDTPYGLAVVEGVFVIGIFAAGLIVRILQAQTGTEEASYFETAMVVKDGEIAPLAHGAQYFYVMLLRFLFSVVGNQWMAGIVLQIVLQMLAAGLLYVGIRMLAGPLAGVFMLAGVMLLPQSIAAGLTYSPKMLYLCLYGAGFLWAVGFLDRRRKGRITRWYHLVDLPLLGVYVALLSYLDAAGLTLWFILAGALWQAAKDKLLAAELSSVLVGFVAGVAGLLLLDAMQSGSTAFAVWNVWSILFGPKRFDFVMHAKTAVGALQVKELFLLLAGCVCIFAGIPGFYSRRRTENLSICALLFGSLGLMELVGMPAASMSYDFLLLTLFCMLAGAAVRQLLYREEKITISEEEPMHKVQMPGRHKEKPEENTKAEQSAETAAAADNIPENADKTGAGAPIKFIENPLPLPPKHVKKTMGYGVEVEDKKMDYDIEISENDDFDI